MPRGSRRRDRCPAFTLIELLVVIAIIALLISILLPSLSKAREAARAVVCTAMLRQLGQAQSSYAGTWKDYIAGTNTSGADANYYGGANIVGETTSTTPVSIHDWFSPTLGDSAGLPANRAMRTLTIFNKYACASARAVNQRLYPFGAGGGADRADFDRAQGELVYRQISYLAPEGLHYISNQPNRNLLLYTPPGTSGPARALWRSGFPTPVLTPPDYTPRLDKIGTQLSSKVLAADGTRYFDNGVLDFDVSPVANYGSFVDSGPIFNESTAYGRAFRQAPNNVKLTFRHNKSINAVFLDGSARNLSADTVYRRVDYWYPSGSRFTGGQATAEALAEYSINDKIP
ncbi:MAG: prepilin-type N-terminal cleavage/methylation domain-containing protein [Planctomycetota bacterium]|nr:prepilin-type N-terminal cleavage/methylation domain-containing protein [Planctomycetota bacterium]